jgi:hypothetical protein
MGTPSHETWIAVRLEELRKLLRTTQTLKLGHGLESNELDVTPTHR